MISEKGLKTQITRKTKELENLDNTIGVNARKQKIMEELTELDLKLHLLRENKAYEKELDDVDNLTFIDNLNNTCWQDMDELKEYLLENNYVFSFYDSSFYILRYDYIDDAKKCLEEQELFNIKSGSFTYNITMQGLMVSL